MASNPMQRKARNSFLLGIIVALLITGVVIAMLLLLLKQKSDELIAEKGAKREVYVLNQNVKSGQVLTENMFSPKKINIEEIPSDATEVPLEIQSWFLQTKEGEPLYTDNYGLYLDRSIEENTSDTIIEALTNTGAEFTDSKGKKIATGEYFTDVGGVIEKVTTSTDGAQMDQYGLFFIDEKNDGKTRVYEEELTGEFYIFKIDKSFVGTSKVRVKEYIDIKDVPVLAKVNMNANTVITQQLVVQSDEKVTDDTREVEYNVVVLPMDLMTDDYIDIRLMTPNGQNFIVISKTQVEIPLNADQTYVADTIRLNLREDEILTMSSAIVEAAGIDGAKLYAVKYVEPAMQEEAYTTYIPNAAITQQLGRRKIEENKQVFENVNLVEEAKKELEERYSNAAVSIRNEYLQKLIDGSMNFEQNKNAGLEESMGNSITARQKYLESLNY